MTNPNVYQNFHQRTLMNGWELHTSPRPETILLSLAFQRPVIVLRKLSNIAKAIVPEKLQIEVAY